MDRPFAYQDSLLDRIADGMETMRVALDRQAPYLALAAAREAARAALLALGQAPLRPGRPDLALLREVATASPQRFAGRLEERQALVRATLALLDRMFPRPALDFRGDDRPHAEAASPAAARGARWRAARWP